MSSAMVSQTAQGAVLSVTSNLIAQVISSYKDNVRLSLSSQPDRQTDTEQTGLTRPSQQTPLSLNFEQTLKFALFSIVSNPPNIVWQNYLEDLFPTNVPISSSPEKTKDKPAKAPETQMNKTNVLIKFILDQTFGAVVNTLMFIVFMGYMNASPTASAIQGPWEVVARDIKNKFYPMIMDGYKFWPLVSLVSFLWIPVDKRIVFGCSVGVIWGIYLSLMVDS
ncbi:hypothetical protein K504DRAFT_468563 [Pleomassaria siparia CBS 279.74]|uniref:Integral membrane protein-like protein n=1 Tax=Pleomassaria siparia CBS 279.74 TaxID=1314801 RepID=A0A6G1K6X7_9PLEO|nr:hypothetical protein K504DRAFT_468563 [Pleomassaria siparia CBS 279.74]